MTESVDLTNCEREAIHIPGAIQPHGALVACRLPGLDVEHVSENLGSVLGIDARSAFGRSCESFFTSESATTLRFVSMSKRPRDESPLRLVGANGRPYDAVLHLARPDLLIIELEPPSGEVAFHPRLRRSVARLQGAHALEDLFQVAAEEVRALSGFDRVMVYRFDGEWNGEVVAETKRSDLEPFLGLHYPASDIPAQARRLYTINWLRFIGDVDYAPVPLISPRSGPPLDMSHCGLRSVSPIHCEYLRNMGVTSSMSISLLRDGQLWGLIACHHYSGPRVVGYNVRESAEYLGQALSWHITSHLRQQAAECGLSAKQVEAELQRSYENSGRHDQALAGPLLLELTKAKGAAVLIDNQLYTIGETPDERDIRDIVTQLRHDDVADLFVTDKLSAHLTVTPELEQTASGLLAVALSRELGDYALWFRPSAELVVRWAGEPSKTSTVGEDGIPRLSPRGSFALWKETIRGRSEPWLPWQVSSAENLRLMVLDGAQRRAAELLELNDRLMAADRSKDMFLAAVSHELRTPLHAILGWVQRIRGGTLDEERTHKALSIIERNARIQTQLVDDLLDVARMVGGKLSIRPEPLDLAQVVANALDTVQLSAEAAEIELRVELDEPVVEIEGDSERLQQVVWNLLTNALKFTPRGGTVRVALRCDDGTTRLSVTDNGQGLSAEALPHLFEAFWQVESGSQNARKGLGLGLAITKHIVELHGGQIEASSAGVGKGATFQITLPLPA